MSEARPIYENRETLAEEWRFAERLGLSWNAEPRKLPRHYKIDFAFCRSDEVASFVELKCRENRNDAYETYMISLAKIAAGIQLAETSGVPFIVAVRFANCDLYVPVSRATKIKTMFGGRRDRGDWQDVEPVAHIPMRSFKLIE